MSLTSDFKNLANSFVADVFSDVTQVFVIESKATVDDGQGGVTVAWSTFANVTGFVKTLSAKEMIRDDRIKSDQAKQFSFEYIAGITSDMRISYEGVYYNILAPNDILDATIWIKLVGDKDSAV